MQRRTAVLSGLLLLTGLAGCSSEPEARPLGTDQFYRRDDRGGAITPGPRVTPSSTDTPTAGPADRPMSAVPPIASPSADAINVATEQVKPVHADDAADRARGRATGIDVRSRTIHFRRRDHRRGKWHAHLRGRRGASRRARARRSGERPRAAAV